MKTFEIYDLEKELSIGNLLYYEKHKIFLIELAEYLDEWTAPLLFTAFVKRDIYTIPRDVSLMWVRERIIPVGRQNLGAILKNHRMKEYDEMRLLELSKGICSQDSLMIRPISEPLEYVKERNKHNLIDCTALPDKNILCFFKDGTTKKIALDDISGERDIPKVLANRQLYESCTLGTDGYYITFNDSIDIPAWLLYEKGRTIPIGYEDFLTFAKRNIVDTSESCEILSCTRQNLAYLVKQNQLTPVKENVKGNLYLKKDIIVP